MSRDDPLDDFFLEMERMMEAMFGDISRASPFEASATESIPSRDAHITFQETEDELRVVIDLPGVPKEAISLQCDGRVLRVAATDDHREYDERIRLQTRVDSSSAEATYNNGILAVTFERAPDATEIDLD